MKKQKWVAFVAFALSVVCVHAEAIVENLSVAQRPGTKLVDISYDLSGTASNVVTVSLVVSNATSEVIATNLTGDVGEDVATGTDRMITWDAGADWNGNAAVLTYTVAATEVAIEVSAGMVIISGGTNSGTNPLATGESYDSYYPENYSLTVDTFCMDATEVSKAQWDAVYSWAVTNGYSFDNAGSGKAADHPVHTVNWYDCVKWCNARSERDGRTPCYTVSSSVYRSGQSSPDCNFNASGYRLPMSDEWEYAARGGLSGKRFPWGDVINHSHANYSANGDAYTYDTSPYSSYTFHPDYDEGAYPYTSPVGNLAANGYGLYDMAGNVWEWCNDASGSDRYFRGGSWNYSAPDARCGYRNNRAPSGSNPRLGFRAACR